MKKIEELYRTFRDRLRRFVLSRIPDENVADDILQDVFLTIHNKLDTLEDERKLESWIFQITRNAVADHFREKRFSQADTDSVQDLPDEEDRAFREIADGLEEMVEELPDQYREAIQLSEFRGMPQKELANRLNISYSGAKSRVQRGRKMLKDMLMECCHFEFDRFGKIIDYHPQSCPCCPEDTPPK
jgi:RNA polymerase sigma-70 factor, ECF subfamily